ncbi:MAG: AI-2E family transporter [Lachnospiraceae bacterium]|nr:AI-2E family transporter [Lachnospiraceae bacterium]
MKINMNNKYTKWGVTGFCVVAASICFYYVIFHISNILANLNRLMNIIMPVLIGLIIAYLLAPVLNSLERNILNPLFDTLKIAKNKKRDRWVRGIGVILTSVLLILILYILISMLISQIVPSIQNIVKEFDTYVNNLSSWLNKMLEDNPDLRNYVLPQVNNISQEVEDWLADTANWLDKSGEVLKTVSMSIINILKFVWNFVIGFIISIYVLCSKETFASQGKKVIYASFDRSTANTILRGFRFVHHTFSGFISGKVLDSVIIGLLCFIGTTLLNIPYAMLVSVIVGVTNIIPFFGPYLGAIPSAFLILLVDLAHPQKCLYFIIFILVLQQFDGNVLGPKILGDSTGLSSFWVIFAITVFGGMFGIPGMIIGVPVFAVIFASVKYSVNRSLQKKELPIDSTLYLDMSSIDEKMNFCKEEESSPAQHKNTIIGKSTVLRLIKKIKKNNSDKKAGSVKKSDLNKEDGK